MLNILTFIYLTALVGISGFLIYAVYRSARKKNWIATGLFSLSMVPLLCFFINLGYSSEEVVEVIEHPLDIEMLFPTNEDPDIRTDHEKESIEPGNPGDG